MITTAGAIAIGAACFFVGCALGGLAMAFVAGAAEHLDDEEPWDGAAEDEPEEWRHG